VMAVTAVGKEMESATPVTWPWPAGLRGTGRARGQDILVQGFRQGHRRLPGPGGDRRRAGLRTELEVFEFVYDGLQNGAIGVNLGRNVWKNAHPVAMIQALNAVIHGGATPREARQLFEELKQGGNAPEKSSPEK